MLRFEVLDTGVQHPPAVVQGHGIRPEEDQREHLSYLPAAAAGHVQGPPRRVQCFPQQAFHDHELDRNRVHGRDERDSRFQELPLFLGGASAAAAQVYHNVRAQCKPSAPAGVHRQGAPVHVLEGVVHEHGPSDRDGVLHTAAHDAWPGQQTLRADHRVAFPPRPVLGEGLEVHHPRPDHRDPDQLAHGRAGAAGGREGPRQRLLQRFREHHRAEQDVPAGVLRLPGLVLDVRDLHEA
mmetsp:Transcript_4332/g.12741  ORF Transcript_4332/g.12741 Transcript_4332/m.12741 type:complete len:238 (-) Transcript_4332:461-1174(-)